MVSGQTDYTSTIPMIKTEYFRDSNSLCKAAASCSLVLCLIHTTLVEMKDAMLREWVTEDLQRIKNGLDYLERDCQIDMTDVKLSMEKVIQEYEKGNWYDALWELNSIGREIVKKVWDAAGYEIAHF